MGILDDLKAQREAHERRAEEQAAHARRIQQIYARDLLPRLQRLYVYLSELVDHLNAMELSTNVRFSVASGWEISGYDQRGYRIRVDSEDRMSEISLTCRCERDTPARLEVANAAERDEVRQFLDERGVRFHDHPKYDRQRVHVGHIFDIAPRLDAGLQIRVDMNSLETRFSFCNLGALGWRDLDARPADLDDGFPDRLARYLLQSDESLFQLGMTDTERLKLKEHFERQQRERRLSEVLARQYNPAPEDPQVTGRKALNRLFDKLRRK